MGKHVIACPPPARKLPASLWKTIFLSFLSTPILLPWVCSHGPTQHCSSIFFRDRQALGHGYEVLDSYPLLAVMTELPLCPWHEMSYCSYVVTLDSEGFYESIPNRACIGWIGWIFHLHQFWEYVCIWVFDAFPFHQWVMLYYLVHNYKLSIFSLAWGMSQCFSWLACTLACQNRQWSLHRCNCFKWVVSSIQFPFEKKQMSLLLGWEVVCSNLSHLTPLRWNICAVLFCVLR